MLLFNILIAITAIRGEVVHQHPYKRLRATEKSKYQHIHNKGSDRVGNLLKSKENIENESRHGNYNFEHADEHEYTNRYEYGTYHKSPNSPIETMVEFLDQGLQTLKDNVLSTETDRQLTSIPPVLLFAVAATGVATVGAVAQTGILDDLINNFNDLLNPTTKTITSTESSIELGTCIDNILNGDEIGIDCGGSCPLCKCPVGQFTCSSDPLSCIPTSKRCNGIENDCSNNSDETDCEGVEAIEQEITLGNGRSRPIQIHKRNFANAGEFEAKKSEFIQAIAFAYGYAENLIEAQLKDGETNIIVITFTITDMSQKDSILAVIEDDSKLKASLNNELNKIESFESLIVIGVSEAKSEAIAVEDDNSVAQTIQALMALLETDFPSKGTPFPTIAGPKPNDKVCIVGGGPAGIHMASSLKERGFQNLIIFEKTGRVGGKSEDIIIDGFYRPLTTVFLTADYFDTVVPLAQKYGVGELRARHGESGLWSINSGIDAKNRLSIPEYFMSKWVEMTGDTSPTFNLGLFIDAIIRYTQLHYSLFGKYEGEIMPKPSEEVLTQISGTLEDFLEANNLSPLIPLFVRTQTIQGYGYLDEIGAIYGLIHNTPNLVISMALNALGVKKDPYQIYILKDGFEKVWNTIVSKENFDIRYYTNIRNIDRNEDNVILHYSESGSRVGSEECGFLIWTPPMPELVNRLSNPSNEERELFSELSSHVFVSTLIKETNIIRNRPITVYQENVDEKVDGGVTADLNVEDELSYCEVGCNSTFNDYINDRGQERILSVFQLQREATSEVISNEILRNHYQNNFGASNIEFVTTKSYDYFYKWTPDELEKGNHWKVFNLQGMHRTWYAGASVCFDSVKSVMEYNELLLRQMGE